MITFNESTKTFYLDGKGVTYAFMINKRGFAQHLYFGNTIGHDDLTYTFTIAANCNLATIPGIDEWKSYDKFPAEISFYGTGDYREPSVEVQNETGDRLTELLYIGHEILSEKPRINGMPSMRGGETLVVHLKDSVTKFGCDLYYTVYDDAAVIARRAVFNNGSDKVVRLNRAYSFTMALPERNYEVMTLHGAWARERQVERVQLGHNVVAIDSKRGSSSATMNPFMALLTEGATEEMGEVYGASLVYSSSFALKAEGYHDGQVRIMGGINDFDFSWKLEAGEIFETPEAVLAYSAEGLGGMSRAYHDAYRNHLVNERFAFAPRPVVINNWEGTTFHFDNPKLKAIADGVKGTGIDTFVLDDGWFGVRDNDRSGLGDWFVNEKKMVGGLDEIINYVNSLGMKFGLWFEPEMISEDSDIFRAHPDYAIGAVDRPRCYCRHQYMMDITRPEVRDYIVDSVNKILRNHHIEYVKWDSNRNLTEMVSLKLPADRQQEFAHRYALGLYDLCDRIVEANPTIFFEGCSGGGGRFDPAMLQYFSQSWTSDNTDSEDRTQIQYGTSIVYPLSSMTCHVNHSDHIKNATKVDIAHLGPTGYELDASHFTDEDRARIKLEVEEYRKYADLILKGDLYRIESPFEGDYFTECIVSKDKSEAIMIAYRRLARKNNEIKRVRAAGLAPDKRYRVEELDRTLSGSTLMNVGWQPSYPNYDFAVVKYHITEVK